MHKNKIDCNESEQCSEVCIAVSLCSLVVNLEEPLSRTPTTFCIFPSATCSPVFSTSSSHSLPLFPGRSLNYSSQLFSNSESPVFLRVPLCRERCFFWVSKAAFLHECLAIIATGFSYHCSCHWEWEAFHNLMVVWAVSWCYGSRLNRCLYKCHFVIIL